MKHHVLKMLVQYCDAKLSGEKPWEVRKNDRDFCAGDTVEFVAVTPEGQRVAHEIEGIRFEIPYVLEDFGLLPGWVAFTTRRVAYVENHKTLAALVQEEREQQARTGKLKLRLKKYYAGSDKPKTIILDVDRDRKHSSHIAPQALSK